MLQGKIVGHFARKRCWRRRSARRCRWRDFFGWRCGDGFTAEVAAFLIVPGLFVVNLLLWVKARVEAIFGQLESVFDNEGGVRVIDQVILGDAIVLDGVADYAAEKRDVGPRADLYVQIGIRCRTRKAGIDDNRLRVAMNLGFNRPLESTWMVFGWVASHDQHHVGILDVDPAVRHCAASKGGPQTGDRWAVSNPGLVFQVADPQAAHTFDGEIIKFVGVGAAAGKSDAFAAVDGAALRVLFDEGCVARLFYQVCEFVISLIPGDVFPVGAARAANLWFEETALVQN